MGTVFISYRRGDTAGEARALYNELTSRFGEESVFMDVDNIALGRDFRQALHERLESCDLMLVLVGRDWVDARNSSGARRLEDPTDFVSLEIEAALKRNIAVTPVLVQGAQMPTLEQLPANVKDFAYRNGFELSHSRWESDVQEMFKRLHLAKPAEPRVESPAVPAGISAVAPAVAQRAARKPWAAIAAAALALAAIAGGGILYFQRAAEENARIEQQRLASEKAKADTEAKLAASKAEAQRAQADAQAANARAEAARAEQQRLASEKAKADAEAKLAARKAEADRAQADARAANVKAAAQAEQVRVANAAEAGRSAQRTRWKTGKFPPPNGGMVLFAVTSRGDPACASYDGGGCLWGLTYDQIDFSKLKPLVCGQAHKAMWGVTGYEDPKHWCSLARKQTPDRY